MALSLAISWQTLLSAAQKGTAFPCVKRNTKVSSLSCWLKSSFPLRMPAPLPAGAVGTARRAESRLNFTSSLNLGPVLASFPKKKKTHPKTIKQADAGTRAAPDSLLRGLHPGCLGMPPATAVGPEAALGGGDDGTGGCPAPVSNRVGKQVQFTTNWSKYGHYHTKWRQTGLTGGIKSRLP